MGIIDTKMILGIIQARMGSSRLPGKTLRELNGKPLIEHVIERVLFVLDAKKVVLATTTNIEDDILVSHVLKRYGIKVYRGHPNDVRSRFVQIGAQWGAETIIRITADDPFKDPEHLLLSQKNLLVSNADYYNNFEPQIYPVGMDVECFKYEALERNSREDQSSESMEHVTWGLRRGLYYKRAHEHRTPEFIGTRLTIDTEKDFAFCNNVAEIIGPGENFDWGTTRRALMSLGVHESKEG